MEMENLFRVYWANENGNLSIAQSQCLSHLAACRAGCGDNVEGYSMLEEQECEPEALLVEADADGCRVIEGNPETWPKKALKSELKDLRSVVDIINAWKNYHGDGMTIIVTDEGKLKVRVSI
jgi:hypothetical protein